MRSFTAHIRPGSSPVLVAEGFSLWAALLPLPWLVLNGAWLVAVLWLAAAIGAAVLAALLPAAGVAAGIGLALASGVFARDWRRFGLGLAGYSQRAVVLGTDEDAALARLATLRPDLIATAYGPPLR